MPDDQQLYRVAAQLLGLALPLRCIARACAAATGVLAVGLATLAGGAGTALCLAACAQLLAWAYAEWLAARIALDADIFRQASQFPWDALDQLAGKPARPAAQRVAGAMRLLRHLGGVTGLGMATAMLAMTLA